MIFVGQESIDSLSILNLMVKQLDIKEEVKTVYISHIERVVPKIYEWLQ